MGVDAVEEERYAFAHMADDDPELRQLIEDAAEDETQCVRAGLDGVTPDGPDHPIVEVGADHLW